MAAGWDVTLGFNQQGAVKPSPDSPRPLPAVPPAGHRAGRPLDQRGQRRQEFCCCRHRAERPAITGNFSAEEARDLEVQFFSAGRLASPAVRIIEGPHRRPPWAENVRRSLIAALSRPGHGGGVAWWVVLSGCQVWWRCIALALYALFNLRSTR